MINYVTGDATRPQGPRPQIIAHVCNDVGAWGKGFVMAVSNRWAEPERRYRALRPHQRLLGLCQIVQVNNDMGVANMIAQVLGDPSGINIRYEALDQCLLSLAEQMSNSTDISIHMPRIGCGLAGGRWEMVEPLIRRRLCDRGFPVTVYDLPAVSQGCPPTPA